MKSFLDKSDLSQWLTSVGIDITAWGTGGSKTVGDLWREIQNGESLIRGKPPLRILSGVVQLRIRKGGRFLFERAQSFGNQRVRKRNIWPSEKMRPKETIRAAAFRCLKEEFNITPSQVRRLLVNVKPDVETKDSVSYPGLLSEFRIFTVDTDISGLPDSDFATVEGLSRQITRRKTHYWSWQASEPVSTIDDVTNQSVCP